MKFYRRSGLLHLPCKRPAEDKASMFEVEFAETLVLTNPLAEEDLGVHVQNSYVRHFTARRRGLTLQVFGVSVPALAASTLKCSQGLHKLNLEARGGAL